MARPSSRHARCLPRCLFNALAVHLQAGQLRLSKRRFIGAANVSTNAPSQWFGGKQAMRFHNNLLGMYPPGLDRVEPRTCGGQKERQDAYSFALLLALLVMLSDPGLHGLAVMEGGHGPRSAESLSCLVLAAWCRSTLEIAW